MLEGAKCLCPKVWTWTKILSSNIRYFVVILRIVAIYALWAKKCFFLVKYSLYQAGSEVLHGIYCLWNLQICNYAPKRSICRENSKLAPDKSFVAIFALAERLPTSPTLSTQTLEYYKRRECSLLVICTYI